jgi:hypothetical protein
VVVPPSSGLAGPALTFFYKAPAPAEHALTVQASGTSPTLTYDDTYHQGRVCLDPNRTGRSQIVTFTLAELTPSTHFKCDLVTTTNEHAFVDDLAATTDPSCPTQ